jgi:hypothetical protein
MAGDFGFKIVQNRECTDAEYQAAKAADGSPDCLMTRDQLNDNDAVYRTDNAFTGTFLAGEMCFNSASSVLASLVSVVTLAAVSLVL